MPPSDTNFSTPDALVKRRALITAPLLLPLSGAVVFTRAGAAAVPAAAVPIRVVSLDWGLAETLLSLGVVPEGIANVSGYRHWFPQPALPADVIDIGSGTEPNLELLADIRPDVILITQQFLGVAPQLNRIARTLVYKINAAGGHPYDRSKQVTVDIAGLLGLTSIAERLVTTTETAIAAARSALQNHRSRPVYLFNVDDARHVTVFAANSLFQDVLDSVGLQNAWSGPTNAWGFRTVGVEQLADETGAQLVCIGQDPDPRRNPLFRTAIWRELPAVRAGSVSYLPPVLFYGMLPTASRFATLLAANFTMRGTDDE